MLEVLPEPPGPRTLVVACDALAEEGLMFDEVSPFVSLDVVMIFTVLKVVVARKSFLKLEETRPEAWTRVAERFL